MGNRITWGHVDADNAEIQAAARTLGLCIYIQTASSERDIDAALANSVQQRVKALMVAADAYVRSRRDQLAALAARYKVLVTYAVREHVVAGGLRREKPADLPVMQSTKFEPPMMLTQADEVIDPMRWADVRPAMPAWGRGCAVESTQPMAPGRRGGRHGRANGR